MSQEIDDALLQFIRTEFPAGKAVGLEDPLLEGIVDSVGIFAVVGFIENHFKVTLDDQELIAENFRTVGALAQLVRSKLSPK